MNDVENELASLKTKLATLENRSQYHLQTLTDDINRLVSQRIDDAKIILEAELRRDFLDIFKRKLQEESDREDAHYNILDKFFPLIEVITQRVFEELDFKGQFEQLLLKELENNKHFEHFLTKELKEEKRFEAILGDLTAQYLALNQKVALLSNLIEELENKHISTMEELSEKVRNIISMLEDNSNISISISAKLYEIQSERDLTIEQVQQAYREIIDLLEEEKEIIKLSAIVRTFEPLAKSLLETELDEKGRFVKLLEEKISEISSENASNKWQKHFKALVDNIVGKGTQNNEKMARENVAIGLRRMSDVDIDEILGRKILKIVDNRSGLCEALDSAAEKITKRPPAKSRWVRVLDD